MLVAPVTTTVAPVFSWDTGIVFSISTVVAGEVVTFIVVPSEPFSVMLDPSIAADRAHHRSDAAEARAPGGGAAGGTHRTCRSRSSAFT